jgi:hypothetical protein
MSTASNPIMTLLSASKPTVSLPERELADSLHLWLQDNYPLFLIGLAGKPGSEWPQDDADKLKAAMLEREGSRVTSVRMLAMLAYVVEEANRRHKLELVAPGVPALKLRPKNKWEQDVIERRKCAEQIAECIDAYITHCVQEAAPNQRYLPLVLLSTIAYVVLLSTIAYGGSLNAHTLAAQVRALADPSKGWTFFSDWPQIELNIWCGKQAPPERRLWFPDAATALLLLRFENHLAEEAAAIVNPEPGEGDFEEGVLLSWIWTQAFVEFRGILKPKDIKIRSLSALLGAMTALYQRYIDPTTLSYMTRETLSSSVRLDTFARVHGAELLRAPDYDVSVVPEVPFLEKDEEEDIEIEEWKRDVREALKLGSTAARQELDRLAAALTFPPGKRVAEFGSFLIANKGAWGNGSALSTVRLHTRNVANLLCDVLEGKDPVRIPAPDLATLYFDILEEFAEKPKRRLSVAHSLIQFHFFLMSKHKVDEIEYGELGLKDVVAGSANANIAVESEIERIRERIRKDTSFPDDPLVAQAAEVVFLIALRAPARHDEVENIRLSDILYEDPKTGKIAELFLRPWGAHTMKSDASVRRTDFQFQFEPNEREVVESWVRGQATDQGDLDEDQRVFHWQSGSRGSSSWPRIMSVVFSAMREVTLDPGFRLHHLRHATCSRMFVESMLRQFFLAGGTIDAIPKDRWPFQLLGDETVEDLLNKDFRILYGTSKSTRKAQYATAQRLGHSGTDVGCTYYNHAFDGWQSFALENSQLAPQKQFLVLLSGLSQSQAYKIADDFGVRKLVQRLIPPFAQWASSIGAQNSPASPGSSQSSPDPWASIMRCWDFLVRSTHCSTADQRIQLALDCDLDPVKALRMIERAEELQKQPKFPMIEGNGKRLYVPPKPRLGQNKTLAHQLALGMTYALENFYQDTVDGIADWEKLLPAKGMRLTFRKPTETPRAARQRDLLEHIGAPYRWVSYDPKERSKSRAEWRKEIGIHASIEIEREPAPKDADNDAATWIVLEPVFMKSRGKGQPSGAEAFLFVMLMTAIAVA